MGLQVTPTTTPSLAYGAPPPVGSVGADYNYGMQPSGTSGDTQYLEATVSPMAGQVGGGGNQYAAPSNPVYRDAFGNERGSAGEANMANARGNSGRTSANNYIGANDVAWQNFQTGYGQRGRNLVDTARNTQDTINTSRGNNALNLRRSMAAIASGVRNGLRSGGVNLANMNALDSGAADAMARAWARAGGGQVGDARNQAATANRQLDVDQGALNRYRTNELADLGAYGRGNVNTSRASLGQNLDATAAGLGDVGLGGLIDTGADERWADSATQWLLQQDADYQGQLAGITPWEQAQIDAKAYEWDLAGREGASPFDFGSVDQGAQMTGAPISQLPIYTRRRDIA
jgi:hypothetical protein